MNIAAFNWIDWCIVAVIACSILISLARGFVREAISLVTWIAAIWLAYRYKDQFAASLLSSMDMGSIRVFVAAAIIFFAVLILGGVVNFCVGQFINFSMLSIVDRILGMAFGLARGILLGGIFIVFGEMTELAKKEWWTASQLIPEFSGISVLLKNFVPEEVDRLKAMSGSLESEQSASAVTPTTPASSTSATTTTTPTEKAPLPAITIQVTPPA